MVRYYACWQGFHALLNMMKISLKEPRYDSQHIQKHLEVLPKGIVSDHWSTVVQTVTYIGFGIKIPTNLGLHTIAHHSIHTLIFTEMVKKIWETTLQLSFLPAMLRFFDFFLFVHGLWCLFILALDSRLSMQTNGKKPTNI